jgi:hypothetical protein
MPLPEPVRTAVLAVLAEAEKQLNDELMRSWYTSKADPEAARIRRQGVADMRLRATALLTRKP